jgi:hypothetical protein
VVDHAGSLEHPDRIHELLLYLRYVHGSTDT